MNHDKIKINLPFRILIVLGVFSLLLSFLPSPSGVLIAAGNTYYVSAGGKESNSGTIDAPLTFQQAVYKASPGDTILVRGGQYAGVNMGRIDIKDKNGSASAWFTIRAYPGETVIMDGQNATTLFGAQALNFNNSSYWRVEGLQITRYTGGGIYLTNRCHHIEMTGLTISNLDNPANNGIGVAGIMADNNTSYCSVTYSHIYNVGLKLNQPKDHGIYIGYSADHWTLASNRIHDTAGAGIHLYGEPNGGSDCIIRDNLVYNNHAYGLVLATNATGNLVRNNILFNNKTADLFLWDNAHGNTFLNNLFGSSQGICNIDIADAGSRFNTYDYNEYRKSKGTVINSYFALMDFSKWRVTPQEAHGYFSSTSFPEGSIVASDKPYTMQRLNGASRYATARAIAEQTVLNKTIDHVILASGEDFPDALSGSVLACKLDAPILLAGTAAENQEILSFIRQHLNSSGSISILGGTGAVDSSLEDALRAAGYDHISRIAGDNRYETNQAINDQISAAAGTPAVIASGNDFPDALSISSTAGAKGYPIILSDRENLPVQGQETLRELRPSLVYIVGGPGVLSADVFAQVKSLTGLDDNQIIRLWGNDRYETSLTIARYFQQSGTTTAFAYGENFPDALAGSVLAAQQNAPIVLIGRTATAQKSLLDAGSYSRVLVFGGAGAVSHSLVEQLTR